MNYTEDQIKLKAFIEEQNELSRKKAEEAGMKLLTTTVSDPEHWAKYGVHNIEQFKHEEAASIHYDYYKELNGIRPRWMKYDKMTTAEIKYEIEQLDQQAKDQEKFEAEQKAKEEAEAKARKEANKYQPNNAFSGLKDMMR